MIFKHREIDINVDEKRGDFYYVIDGRFSRSPSVAAAKKAIDKHHDNKFTPFKALVWEGRRGNGKTRVVTVVGIRRPIGRVSWRNRPVFILADKTKGGVPVVEELVYPLDTGPLIDKIEESDRAFRKTEEQYRNNDFALRSKLKVIKPDNMTPHNE